MYCWYKFFLLAVPTQTEAAKILYQQYCSLEVVLIIFAVHLSIKELLKRCVFTLRLVFQCFVFNKLFNGSNLWGSGLCASSHQSAALAGID